MPTTTGKASELITFSRTSNATLVDSDGRIKWAPHNLLLASEQFDAASWTKTSLSTGAPAVTANSAVAPNGTTTADKVDFGAIAGASFASILGQTFTAEAVPYTFRFWVKAVAAGDVGKKIWLALSDPSITGLVAITLTADWQYVSTTATVTAGAGRKAEIYTLGSTFGGENQGAVSVYIWGASLTRSDLGGMKSNTSAYPMYNPTTPKNLLGYTEDFTVGTWNKDATVTGNTEVAPNGLQTADTINGAVGTYVTQVVSGANVATPHTVAVYLKAGTANVIRVSAYKVSGGSNGYVEFNLTAGTAATPAGAFPPTNAAITLVGGWYRCSFKTAFDTGTGMGVALYNQSGASGNYYAWGAQLSDSASLDTYVPNYGAAPTAAAYYGPRLEFDPVTLAAKGLLVEELRVNRFLHTAEFDNTSYWTTTGAVTAGMANAAVAPTGTSVADALTEDTSTGVHRIYGAATLTAATYTMSLYVKANGRQWLYFYLDTGIVTGFFNFTTNTYVPATGSATVSSVPVGDSWYRVTVTYPNTNTSSQNLQIWLATNGTTNSYAGDGTSGVYIWGAQLELGSFATSYMPNGSSVSGATRNADVASVSTQAFPYSSTEGTLVANGSFISLTDTSVSVMASLNNNNSTNSVNIYRQSAAIQMNTFSSGANTVTYSVAASTTPIKAAIAYKLNDANAAVNGTAQTADTTSALPIGVDRLDIGRMWASYGANGWIRQITYIPRRLSDAELAARTAL
jgi:hypothetical protein